MSEDEQWTKAIELANQAIQDVGFMTVSEMLEDDDLDDGELNDIHEKLRRLVVSAKNGQRHTATCGCGGVPDGVPYFTNFVPDARDCGRPEGCCPHYGVGDCTDCLNTGHTHETPSRES